MRRSSSRLNKTDRLEVAVTPAFKKSVVECARKLTMKPSEWVRSTLANAVMAQCFKPETAPQQEQTNERD